MKRNPILRIVLYSVGAFLCLGILLSVLFVRMFTLDPSRNKMDVIDSTEMPRGMDQFILTDEIRNIEIEWISGSVSVHTGMGIDDIIVTEYYNIGNETPMVYKQTGQTLKIQYSKEMDRIISFGLNVTEDKDLIILVPEDWAGRNLHIETASADVSLNNIQVQEFEFEGASGTCNMSDCQIGELDMDTASGDVCFTGTLDVLDCDAASANCTVEVWNTPKSIEVDAASGNLDLVLPENAGFTCHMETMSGTFESDFDCTTENNMHHYGDGDCKINVSAMSGNVYIYKGTTHHPENHHK